MYGLFKTVACFEQASIIFVLSSEECFFAKVIIKSAEDAFDHFYCVHFSLRFVQYVYIYSFLLRLFKSAEDAFDHLHVTRRRRFSQGPT